ncbi:MULTISPECIES: MFS transporter [unclassified Arthrobacter]|uniref:MFS transporter n=1 Tax=unclassified Arthrobacter TaxID=235627 RepID=UPI00159E42D6|nr:MULTISPECIES: MFS transporter [unclassified Arthrobacter]MCQ9165436.1 MHS family MFS transporter [Arthrobacter sp. STN4]NVM98643.1 MHS family MFS transporter [Arthrobacter sp. SDTb3-6]
MSITPTPQRGPDAGAKRLSDGKDRRRALVSGYLGSTVEFYDFLLYGTAASLVFPELFFSGVPEAVGVVLSYVTLAVGYVARPLGGVIFGHFGDRYGRKKMLFVTMALMGAASVLVGALPGSAQIGVLAPVLLVTLRVIQGIAVGGEWAGATLLGMEHSKAGKRGFSASIAVSGGPSGSVLATIVLALFTMLPAGQFLAWGWRVPFLLSGILVVIALWLRYRVTESPIFLKAQLAAEAAGTVRAGVPVVTVLRNHWKAVLVCVLAGLAPLFLQSLMATFTLTYAVKSGQPQTQVLLMMTISTFLHIFAIPAWAALSDRVGRRPVLIAGTIVGLVVIWPIFALVGSGNIWLLLLGYIMANPIAQAMMYGPIGAFISEKFPTKLRYTGVSLSYQLATTLGAGFAPLIAAGFLATGHGSTWMLSAFFGVLCVVSGLAFFVAKETGRSNGAESDPASFESDGLVKA